MYLSYAGRLSSCLYVLKTALGLVELPQRAMRAMSLSLLGAVLGLGQWLMWFPTAAHPLSTEQWVGRAILGVIGLCWLAALKSPWRGACPRTLLKP
ncbi:MAG: hypothetical protein M0Z36_10270 [Thermaerobacter sp.]|nr:hypothetical protein [Thermaerobacter sp.]